MSEDFQDLARRVQALEDERAIQSTLTRYGFAVDSGDAEATMALYAEDTHIDIDTVAFMDGREATRNIVESPTHQAILPNCAHIMGPFVVQLDGDKAIATGYGVVIVKEDGVAGIWRLSYGHWELERREGRWQITQRISRSVGRDDAQALLKAAL
jgi:ketosteroid isomerase-like protein